MSDDFIIEEEESSSPFLMVAAALTGVLVLALLCIGTVLFVNQGGDGDGIDSPAYQTRVAENEAIAATNTAIAVTREAIERLAALPTATLEPTNTPRPSPSPSPTATPRPTETPVVQLSGDDPTATTDLSGISLGGGLATSTPVNSADGSTLPNTGIESWGAVALALFFLSAIVVVRRLRTD